MFFTTYVDTKSCVRWQAIYNSNDAALCTKELSAVPEHMTLHQHGHENASDVGLSGTSLFASSVASRAKPNSMQEAHAEADCAQLNDQMDVGDKIGTYSSLRHSFRDTAIAHYAPLSL